MQLAVSIADVIYHLVAAVALIVGGGWAYFKFIRGRSLKPRLSIEVSGRLVSDGGKLRLVARAQAQNVGLREVALSDEATSLSIYSYGVDSERGGEMARLASWRWIDSWPVFESRARIEPDEPIEEQLLIELPAGGLAALRLEFVAQSPSEHVWETSEVVVLRSDGDNEYT